MKSESGHAGDFSTPDIIGYGPGNNAWSFTITPTYQWKQFFGRAELSYVTVGSGSDCSEFGTDNLCESAPGNKSDQVRLMFETGVVL